MRRGERTTRRPRQAPARGRAGCYPATLVSARFNKTLDYADLRDPEVAPTVASMKRWIRRWLLSGAPLGVNGAARRRWYVRPHKLWEYSRGLALTAASAHTRPAGTTYDVLDVGGAMTLPVFHLAGLGDRLVCLDIDDAMIEQTSRIADRKRLTIDARTTDLVNEEPSPADLGAPDGFDRIYSFCVIEHVRPPGQATLAARMGRLLKPGGRLCITFDFGENAPTEAPMYAREHVDALAEAIGLPPIGEPFLDTGRRYPLNKRYPDHRYTFGSLFFERPAAEPPSSATSA